ncbi:MAG: hypothetical protein HYX66_09250 [Ignavibacteria bacterium]|nr:hypothetical protein [Ignavibacteria bacterium]
MKKILGLLCIFAALTGSASAAHDWNTNISYTTASGTGNLGDYIERFSWTGFGVSIQYRMDDFNYVGVTSGWQRFDALYRDRTQQLPQGAVFGTQLRIVSLVPFR